jgi:hypothetical protein
MYSTSTQSRPGSLHKIQTFETSYIPVQQLYPSASCLPSEFSLSRGIQGEVSAHKSVSRVVLSMPFLLTYGCPIGIALRDSAGQLISVNLKLSKLCEITKFRRETRG